MEKEEEPDDDRLAPSEASDSPSPAPREPFRTVPGDGCWGPSRGTKPVAKLPPRANRACPARRRQQHAAAEPEWGAASPDQQDRERRGPSALRGRVRRGVADSLSPDRVPPRATRPSSVT